MRRTDRATGTEEALGILATAEYGVLSMASPDGEPYGIPLNFSFTDNCIYFHCAPDGRKTDIFAVNSRVSFAVVGKTKVVPEQFGTEYESVVVSGVVQELFGAEKKDGLLALISKYAPEHLQKGIRYIDTLFDKTKVFKICVHTITGKACTQCTA